MALPGDHASLIKRALTQLATLFEWRSSHVIGDDHDDRYYTETEVDSLFYTEAEVDALIAGIPLTNPGGSNQQVQFNNSGSFGGSSSLTFDSSTGKLTANGSIHANTAGVDGGLALRDWTNNGGFQSLATVNMTGSEYILLSDGTNTYIGAGTGGTTHIRGPANDSSPQLTVNSSVITSYGDHTVTGTLTANGSARASTSFLVGASGDVGIGPVTGQYGSVQTVGAGSAGGWEGYSINGRAVFMNDGGSATGIYNDVNNQWMVYGVHNAATDIRYAGAAKVTTSSTGATITGRMTSTDATISGTLSCSHFMSDGTTTYFGANNSWEVYLNTSTLSPYTNGGSTLGGSTRYWSGVYSSNWFRSSGATGWYSETYGGGIYMTDTTWVKTYGSKGLYPQGGMAILSPNTTTTYSGYQDLLWNTTWTSVHRYSSKRSMKEQIEPLSASVDAGAVIDLLKPVSFIAAPNPDNEEPETPAEKQMREADLVWGFVAEDVCEIDETTGARLGVYEPSEDGEGFQPSAWAQRAFFPLLVAELQELRKRVAALEADSGTKMFAPETGG